VSRGGEQAGDRAFGPGWWEQHYAGAGAGHAPASPQLVAEIRGMPVGTALDAGCGAGADAVWLARQGWTVTAVDVSPTVVAEAERRAGRERPEVARRISWVVADLTDWEPPRQYDLVVSHYVHPGIPFATLMAWLARAVAPGGTLFVVGHDHADSHSAAHAPVEASIGAEAVTGSLTDDLWDVVVAETRTRQVEHRSDHLEQRDVVVKAHRKMPGS
jgi:2-polyprenyl-3-methyl-5-hydroxy-6-metoxy-1,4-benzoquinol methylase